MSLIGKLCELLRIPPMVARLNEQMIRGHNIGIRTRENSADSGTPWCPKSQNISGD